MGTIRKRLSKGKNKASLRPKSRKMTNKGKLKRKRGDPKIIHSQDVSFKFKQGKHGKIVKTGERHCNIHTVCDCTRRTDPVIKQKIRNR